MFLCLLQFFIIRFLILGMMNEVEQNILYSLIFHGPEFILVMKVIDLTVIIFFLHFLFWDPKI